MRCWGRVYILQKIIGDELICSKFYILAQLVAICSLIPTVRVWSTEQDVNLHK